MNRAEKDTLWSELMQKTQSGDEASYALLLNELIPVVHGFLQTRLADRSFIEDVTQEVLISIHKARHTYDSTKPFSPWFFSIVRRRFIDHLRKITKGAERETIVDALDWRIAENGSGSNVEVALDLETLLAKLPNKQREAFVLMKVEGLSVSEAAKTTGMSESAIKVSVHRAKKALRKELVQTGSE